MQSQTKIIVAGVSGRMGQMLVKAVQENPSCTLVGATERSGNDWVGRDLGACLGHSNSGIPVVDDLLDIISSCHALLDFTTPEATVANAELTAQAHRILCKSYIYDISTG